MIDVYERALACGDTEGIAMKELPKIYKEMGQHDKAVEIYETHYLFPLLQSAMVMDNEGEHAMPMHSSPEHMFTGMTPGMKGLRIKSTTAGSSGNGNRRKQLSPRATPTGQYPMYDDSMTSSTSMDVEKRKYGRLSLGSQASSMETPGSRRVSSGSAMAMTHSSEKIGASDNSPVDPLNLSLCLHPPKVAVDELVNNPDLCKALVYVASYYRDQKQWKKAEAYCLLLLDHHGAEGNEARSLLKEIRNAAKG